MIEFSGVDLHDAIILEFVATSHANFLQNACLSLQLVNGKNAKLVFEDCFSATTNVTNSCIELVAKSILFTVE